MGMMAQFLSDGIIRAGLRVTRHERNSPDRLILQETYRNELGHEVGPRLAPVPAFWVQVTINGCLRSSGETRTAVLVPVYNHLLQNILKPE